MTPRINYLAVLVSGILAFAVAALWFSVLFGAQWMAAVGKTAEELSKGGNSPLPYVLGGVSYLITAYVLAHFVHYTKADTALKGAQTGFWLWLGIFAAGTVGEYAFEQRSWSLYLIYAGQYLVTLLAMGAILAVWRKKEPDA